MCTVSFISAGNKKIITSNRDEHIGRETASAPVFETINGRQLIFPKDAQAGGTWFAASEEGTIAVLLNGAFIKHQPQPPYRKSRGLVVLDVISSGNPVAYFNSVELDNIEPFTLITYQPDQLHELRWDGKDKYEQRLNVSENYIWSSATLYDNAAVAERNRLFDLFIKQHEAPATEDVYAFHANNNQDEENGFVIKRSTGLITFSITQAIMETGVIDFRHTDLLQHRQFKETVHINPALINQ